MKQQIFIHLRACAGGRAPQSPIEAQTDDNEAPFVTGANLPRSRGREGAAEFRVEGCKGR